MLITPKNAISIVLERKTAQQKYPFFDTPVQKWLFILAAMLTAFGAAGALITYAWDNKYLAYIAMSFLLLGFVSSVLYQLATVAPGLDKLRNIEKEISSPLLKNFNDDVDLINALCDFEAHHLEFARASFDRGATHLRERLGLLVGALDKVGVIPVAVTAYIAYLKAKTEGLSFGGLEWLSIAFLILYIAALRMSTVAQWMERVAEIFKMAIELKKTRNSRQG